jgi:arylsulfatase A-like enzyme
MSLVAAAPSDANKASGAKPNVVFILADDLGYGDLGVLFQNARAVAGKPALSTPQLDRLAASGVVLRQHYTGAPVCAPARASLLTGQTQGHCPVRDNQFDKALPENLMTLGSMLKHAGYHTGVIGKWGLAGNAKSGFPAHPMRRGFDEFFGYLRHGTGHVYYHDAEHPLMDGETDVGGKYEDVYDTDLFTARAKRFITDHHASKPGEPFFLYLAYTAVHNKLNVPGGAYPAGGGKGGGMRWPVEPTPKTRDTWIHPDYAGKAWSEPMKRYATMVRRLDDGVGDVVQLLRDLKLDRNTLVVFTSDNGPANEGGADPRLFDSWGPLDGFKRDCFEGGVREPTVVAWPGTIPAKRMDDTPGGFWDWMPTLAEAAGLPAPAQSDGVSLLPVLRGDPAPRVAPPYVYVEYNFPKARNKDASGGVFERKGVTGRGQQQMVRIGEFVGVRTQVDDAGDRLRLYDVMKDPHQDHDLAGEARHGELLKRMTELLVTARRPEESAPRPYDEVPLPASASGKDAVPGVLNVTVVPGTFPYTPKLGMGASASAAGVEGLVLPADIPKGPFAAGYAGYLTVPTDGTYTFAATADADSGVHVWIHDAHLIATERGGTGTTTASVPLRAGSHPFRMAYRHGGAVEPSVGLRYSGPGIPEGAIPAAAFSR